MKPTALIVALILALATPLFAQEEHGATVGASVTGVNMSSSTNWAFSGSAGYQFTKMMGLEIEATSVPRLRGSFPESGSSTLTSSTPGVTIGNVTTILPTTSLNVTDGRAVFFTTNVRVQLPTTSARVTPYFVAGGGAASLRRSTDIAIAVPLAGTVIPIPIPVPRPITEHVIQSATDLALTLGGGVDVLVASSHLSVGADFRYFRLFDEQDSNVGRFGASVRYRF